MVVKFKYDRGEVVYYIWERWLGGEFGIIGKGTIEKLIYDSGRLSCPSVDDGLPVYNIRRNRLGCICISGDRVFRTYIEARRCAKEKGIRVTGRILREQDKE